MKLSITIVGVLFSTMGPIAAFQPTPMMMPSSVTSSTVLHMTTAALTRQTGQSQVDPAVIAKYNALPYPADTILAEYVWVDADGNTRSKTRTLPVSKVYIYIYIRSSSSTMFGTS
jgi:hypothetical protein